MAEASHIKSEVRDVFGHELDVSSVSLDKMPQQKKLNKNIEEDMGVDSASVHQSVEIAPPDPKVAGDALNKLLAEGESLSKTTSLGYAVDEFRQRWIELVSCTATKIGYKPSGQEHLKETAESAVAQLAEAGRKLDVQLARTAIRWTIR